MIALYLELALLVGGEPLDEDDERDERDDTKQIEHPVHEFAP
jgi:hypothetical protein